MAQSSQRGKRLAYGHGEQPEWPQLCPFQNRKICQACWYGIHRRHKVGTNELIDGCDGPCSCLHLSEKDFAQDERANQRANRKAKRKLEREAPESTENPLRAENPAFKQKLTGRTHA